MYIYIYTCIYIYIYIHTYIHRYLWSFHWNMAPHLEVVKITGSPAVSCRWLHVANARRCASTTVQGAVDAHRRCIGGFLVKCGQFPAIINGRSVCRCTYLYIYIIPSQRGGPRFIPSWCLATNISCETPGACKASWTVRVRMASGHCKGPGFYPQRCHRLRGKSSINGGCLMGKSPIIEGSQTSDNMDRWKAEQGRGREKRKIRREKSRRERVRRKKMQMREKVGKSRNIVFFQWFVAPEGRKVGSLKRRVRSQLARWELKNCTPLWREAHVQVERYKTPGSRSTFGSWDVEKVHAVVARSTFRSENAQNTSVSDHFWKLRCRKSACRCGAKHISKSKRTKHNIVRPLLEVEMSKKCTPLWREAHFEVKMYKTSVGPLLEVEMSKKCTPLWREAHFEVKMYKTHQRRTTFGSWVVEKVHAVVAEAHFEVKILKTPGGRTTFGGSDVASLRFGSLHYTIHSTTLHYSTLHYTTFHNTTTTTTQLHSTTLH